MNQFFKVRIEKIVQNTSSCVTIYLEAKDEKNQKFKYVSGQYIAIRAKIEDEDIRRSYSISSAPHEEQFCISIKKIEGGKMSTYLNDSLQVGDMLEVMRPEGKFTVIPNSIHERNHYFFAAGSGITPIISMIKSILANEPKSICYLLYGNKDENNIIFYEDLNSLEQEYEGQLFITYTLSMPVKFIKKKVLGIFSNKIKSWKGSIGRINKTMIYNFLKNKVEKKDDSHFYICGPGGMIEAVNNHLLNNDIAKQNIHVEYFSNPNYANPSGTQHSPSIEANMIAQIDGQSYEVKISENKSLLDTLLDQSIDAPFSCTSGACSTCMAKLVDGTVRMETCFALDDDEIENGFILTCQAYPTSSKIKISYDI